MGRTWKDSPENKRFSRREDINTRESDVRIEARQAALWEAHEPRRKSRKSSRRIGFHQH